jgi:hypothetical protein
MISAITNRAGGGGDGGGGVGPCTCRLQIERWKETGAGVEFQLVSDASEREKRAAWGESHTSSSPICEKLHPTIADEVQVQAQVLTHRCGLGDLEHLHDRYSRRPDRRIHAVFPLKDRRWETDFAMRWAKDGGVVKSCKLISREFHALGNDLKLETRAALAQVRAQTNTRSHCDAPHHPLPVSAPHTVPAGDGPAATDYCRPVGALAGAASVEARGARGA